MRLTLVLLIITSIVHAVFATKKSFPLEIIITFVTFTRNPAAFDTGLINLFGGVNDVPRSANADGLKTYIQHVYGQDASNNGLMAKINGITGSLDATDAVTLKAQIDSMYTKLHGAVKDTNISPKGEIRVFGQQQADYDAFLNNLQSAATSIGDTNIRSEIGAQMRKVSSLRIDDKDMRKFYEWVARRRIITYNDVLSLSAAELASDAQQYVNAAKANDAKAPQDKDPSLPSAKKAEKGTLAHCKKAERWEQMGNSC